MIISIYGFGKYKTEASIGCAIRAIANGESVLFTQFLKDGTSSEVKWFKDNENVNVLYGEVGKITLPQNITVVDRFKAQCLFTSLLDKIQSDKYDLIVADEILPAVDMGLVTIEQIEYLIEKCNEVGADLFMTGRVRQRNLRVKIAELSDTCTDAHCIKHSFNTHCPKCKNDYKYHYTYCPDCGCELEKSENARKGRDY